MDKGRSTQESTALVAPKPMFEDSPVFQMACRQLDRVAEVIDLDPGMLERLSQPKRALVVSVPIRMDNGRTDTLHRLSRAAQPDQRPVQGRPALPSQRRSRRSRRPGHVDVVEVRHHEPALRRRPRAASPATRPSFPRGELERLTRRFTEEVLPHHRPAHGRHGPRPGHRRADHGLDHGHLQHERRLRLPGNRHRQTGRAGRLRRPARSHRPRRRLLHHARPCRNSNIAPGNATAVVQGFGNVGSVVCQELAQRGVKIVAVSDRYGAIAQSARASTSPALAKHVRRAASRS